MNNIKYSSLNNQHRIDLATHLINKLNECKFKQENQDTYAQEKIYSLPVRDTGMFIFVYTTIVGQEVRAVGEDAIRVCGVFKHNFSVRGITKEKRVNRVGTIEDIVQRMYERMRETYTKCNVIERCHKCNAPLFISKNDKKFCAAICWNKNN
jgi:hypothetical protein